MLTFLFSKSGAFGLVVDSVIEIPGIILLIACIGRCAQYIIRSKTKRGSYFWFAAFLTFFAVIRRELNYLPELIIASDFSLLNHSYDWWEDIVLTVIYLIIIGLLVYTWRYLWIVLKSVPVYVYLLIISLALLEYMGENAILISQGIGEVIEEMSETGVYAIALFYLWQFKPLVFESYLSHRH